MPYNKRVFLGKGAADPADYGTHVQYKEWSGKVFGLTRREWGALLGSVLVALVVAFIGYQ